MAGGMGAVVAGLACPCFGQEAPSPGEDRGAYSLFNPKPRELWRPLDADRPDATESPRTLDAGAVQLELSFLEFTYDKTLAGTSNTFLVAPFNIKFGMTERTDLQFIWTPVARIDGPGGSAEGVGDLELRYKINIWGNDDGDWAIGFLPSVTFPTGSNGITSNHVSGGVIVPIAFDLGSDWSVGGQVGFEVVPSDAGVGSQSELSHTLVVGIPLGAVFGAYVEYVGMAIADKGDYHPIASGGLTYDVSRDVRFDVGMLVGMDSSDTEDLTVFFGMTWRF